MRYFLMLLFSAVIISGQSFQTSYVTLDGVGDYINVPSNEALDLVDSDFTMEVTFRINEFDDSYNSTLFSKRTGIDFEGYYNGVTGNAYFLTGYPNYQIGHGLNPQLIASSPIEETEVYHLTIVYIKSDHIALMYINGDIIGANYSFPANQYHIDADFNIGFDSYAGAYYFNGNIDEIRIWGVARSQEEIQEYMNSELPSSIYTNPSSGLIAYYKFNETEDLGIGNDGLADDIRDYSLNGFHGDLVGDAHLEYSYQGWQTPITVSDNNNTETSQTLYFGLEVSATEGLDAHLGEVVLPPVPPVGAFDARFTLPDNNPSLRDYRNSENVTSQWELYLQPGQSGYPMTISWNPADLPEGQFLLTDITGELINTDMKTVDNLIIENSEIDKLYLNYSYITSKTFSVNSGWNIVSVPLLTDDMTPGALFDGAISDLFSFDNGYVPVNEVENGKGYWVKYQEDAVIGHYGSVPTGVIPITAGWNLVGPFAETVEVNNLSTTPAGLISSSYYGFSDMYNTTTILEPGKGYWVKSDGDGVINTGQKRADNPKQMIKGVIPEEAGMITISSGELQQRLYLSKKGNLDISGYELPPLPPGGVSDIRFDSGTYLEKVDGYDKGIEIQGITGEIEITVEGMDVELEVQGSRERIRDGESITITSGGSEERLLINTSGVINTYYLANSYPNPFNPTTRIKFNIAEREAVQLTVYDVLGNKVSTLVNETLEAGAHNVEFNGANLASGVYIYKLTTRNFSATRKMVLMK